MSGSLAGSDFMLKTLPPSEMNPDLNGGPIADSSWRKLKPYRGPQANVFQQQTQVQGNSSKPRSGRGSRQHGNQNNQPALVLTQTQQATPLDQWASDVENVQVVSSAGGIYSSTWTGAHNSGDYIAFANSTRSKSEFRVYKPSYQQQQSTASSTACLKLDLVSSIKFPVAAKGAGSCGWFENHVALPARDGTVSVFQWRKGGSSSPAVPMEEPILSTMLSYNSGASSSGSSGSGSRGGGLSGVATLGSVLPPWCVSVDMITNQVVATRQNENIVWNVERPNQPVWVRRVQASNSLNSAAPPFGRIVKWAPPLLWPQQVNYARGGFDGSVKVFDIREASDSDAALSWANPLSTLGTGGGCSISAMTWCPFVGWWLCTAREDGVVSLWDMRWNGGPAVEMRNTPPQITDISWSPNSIDFIGVSSLLRSSSALSIWNLRMPDQAMASISTTVASAQKNEIGENASNPLSAAPPMVGCCFVPGVSAIAPLLGVSASGGQLLSLRIQQDQLKRLTPVQPAAVADSSSSPIPAEPSPLPAAILTNQPPKNKAVRFIEQNIYVRQFGIAFKAALELALQLRTDGRTQEANMVLANCYQRVGPEGLPPAIPRPQPAFGITVAGSPVPASEYASSTASQLEFYSYYIPPNYPDVMWPAVDAAIMFDIEILKMNLELEILQPHELERTVDDVIEFLNRSITTIDAQLLLKTITSLRSSASFISALTLGANIARIYSDWNAGKNSTTAPGMGARTGLFSPATTLVDTDGLGTLYFLNLMNSVMWPTIFESNDDYTSGKSFKVGTTSSRSAASASAASTTISWTTSPEYSPIWGQADLKITPEKLSKQLFLMRDFYQALWGSSKTSVTDAIAIFDNFESTLSSQVLSADVNRLYLKALITCRQWDKFYIKAAQLNEQCRGYPFGTVLASDMANAVPRLIKHCKDSQMKQQKKDVVADAGPKSSAAANHGALVNTFSADIEAEANPRGLGYRRTVRCCFMLANILWNADPKFLPKSLNNQLPALFSNMLADSETSWSVCLGEDDMSSPDPPPNAVLRTAVRQAEEISETLKTLTSSQPKSLAAPSSPRGTTGAPQQQEQPGWIDQVSKFQNLLNEFSKKTKRRLVQRQSAPSSRNLTGSGTSNSTSSTPEDSPAPQSARRARPSLSQAPSSSNLAPPASAPASSSTKPSASTSTKSSPSEGSASEESSTADRDKEREARRLERMASRRAAREAASSPDDAPK